MGRKMDLSHGGLPGAGVEPAQPRFGALLSAQSTSSSDVRLTPKSGHSPRWVRCRLSARSDIQPVMLVGCFAAGRAA